MNHKLRNRLLFFGPTVLLGGLSVLLHQYMMANCLDAKGLLIAGNLPGRLLWIIGIVFGAGLGLTVRTVGGEGSYGDNFSRCLLRGVLMTAAGCILIRAVPELGLLPGWQTVLAYAAAAGMAVQGICRMLGRRPAAGFGGVVCLFYMLMLVTNYRVRGADPQLHEYAYQLLACILLMLCSFHRTCCDAGIIQRKKLLFTGFAAAFCAIAALSGTFQRSFFLASALWSLGCVCSVAVLPPDPEEEETENPPAEES